MAETGVYRNVARRFRPAVQPAWMADPAGWAEHCISWPATSGGLTSYQADALQVLGERHRLAVRSPHGAGKTTIAAVTVLWFALTSDAAGTDWKVLTTAGVSSQLEQYLWPEIRRWARRIDWQQVGREPFSRDELLKFNLNLDHGQAFARTSDDPAFIEGAHADRLLVVADEAKAIPADVFDALEGALSGTGDNYALAISTPAEPVGRFYDIHARKPGYEDWAVRAVSLDQAVAAGRTDGAWAAQKAVQWGADSAVYRNRVLGEFAASDENSVIPLAWVEAAIERWHAWDRAGRPEPTGRRVIGVDVADQGDDLTVFATRQGNVVFTVEPHQGQDTTVTTGQLQAKLSRHPTDLAVVDAVGLGAGVHHQLRAARRPVVAFGGGERSVRKDSTGEFGFVNQRCEQWWAMRERLDPAFGSTVCLPDDDQLIGDLTSPRWSITAGGKIQVERKADVKKRLGRSPDVGDAIIYSFVSSGSVSSSTTGAAVPYTYARVPGGAVPYGGYSTFTPDPSWPMSGSLFEDPDIPPDSTWHGAGRRR